MKFKSLMIIKAVASLGVGPLLLFAPGPLADLLGTSFDPASSGAITARQYGAAAIGVVLLAWFARNEADSTARRAIVLDLFVYDAIGFVATLLILLSGGMNAFGWGVVGIYLFFTVGFGYFAIRPKSA